MSVQAAQGGIAMRREVSDRMREVALVKCKEGIDNLEVEGMAWWPPKFRYQDLVQIVPGIELFGTHLLTFR